MEDLPESLKPYLVLFQSLLFETAVVSLDGKFTIGYKDVVADTSSLLISHDTGVGLGNQTFYSTWLSEKFTIGGSCDHAKWKDMIDHVLKVLFRTVFLEKRVESICKNLLSSVCIFIYALIFW